MIDSPIEKDTCPVLSLSSSKIWPKLSPFFPGSPMKQFQQALVSELRAEFILAESEIVF